MSVGALTSLSFNYWFLQTIAMMATAVVLPRLRITGPVGAFLMVLGLALVNAKIWDAALFFNIPETLTAHAALLFLTNGVIFWTLVKLLPGIEVQGILPALIAPIVFTAFSLAIHHYGREIDWVAVLNWVIGILEHLKEFLQTNPPQSDLSPPPSNG